MLSNGQEIRRLAEATFAALNHLLDAADECRQAIGNRLIGQLDDALIDHMISEVIPDLDELSTHTHYGHHQIEEVAVQRLDSETVTFVVNGSIHVDLQYGSNSDVRNDIGVVISDSYPFTATIESRVGKPERLLQDTLDLSVDTSSFYE